MNMCARKTDTPMSRGAMGFNGLCITNEGQSYGSFHTQHGSSMIITAFISDQRLKMNNLISVTKGRVAVML